MASSDNLFAGSVPETYDRFLVPLIFETYAADLAQRVAASRPKSVLETAAGTGVVTRALAARLGPDVAIVATDLNQPMLDTAARRLGPDGRVAWRQTDATALPFSDQSFDCVACQFGVMFFPDKGRAYSEALRVLEPGGTFHFNVWDRIEQNEFAAVVTDALATIFPADPPRFMARTPHGYHDVAQIRGELAAAGFCEFAVETVHGTSRAESARNVAIACCQGTPLRNEIEARDPSRLEAATEAATKALQQRFGHGAVEGGIRAHVFAATR